LFDVLFLDNMGRKGSKGSKGSKDGPDAKKQRLITKMKDQVGELAKAQGDLVENQKKLEAAIKNLKPSGVPGEVGKNLISFYFCALL
jgi:hypothetical protein